MFSTHHFDEAYHHMLTQCQTKEDADRLQMFKMWWDLLEQIISPNLGVEPCNSCGSGGG